MSESKHTPGPWQVCGTRHTGDLKIGRDARLHMVGPDGDAVAAVFFDMKTGRGFRDARLIAAAPDMVEALRDSAEILFHLGMAGKNPSQDEAIEAVRERVIEAISKAEGR